MTESDNEPNEQERNGTDRFVPLLRTMSKHTQYNYNRYLYGGRVQL